MTIDQALLLASQHHRAGRLREAEAIYRRILAEHPNNPRALNRLAVILADSRQFDQAAHLVRRAIADSPHIADYHFHLGTLLRQLNQLEPAIASYQKALALQPDLIAAHNNLGMAHHSQTRFDDAIASYQNALAINPSFVPAQYNLANALRDKGQIDLAIAAYQRALQLNPNLLEAHNNLGMAWFQIGQLNRAIACFHSALALDPQCVSAHYNLGNALKESGQIEPAEACYRRTLAINPHHPETLCNLGIVLKDMGRLDEALASFRQALAVDPNCIAAHDNVLRALLCLPDTTPQSLFTEFQSWNHQHAEPLKHLIQPHANDRDPHRRLRIGYLSPDFRNHPVAWFMLPLLKTHDRSAVEVFAYAHVAIPDSVTAQVQSHVEVWRDIVALSDQQVADQIRHDRIDILVDVAMHTADNRLLVFARKPAPVQVTYLAYAGGTALPTIDYRLTDRCLEPDPADDCFSVEKPFRLPGTYWCYAANPAANPVNELPALSTGRITFGCLSNFAKVSHLALQTWADLLNRLPDSRLILYIKPGSHRDRTIQFLADRHIAPNRLDIVGWMSLDNYFDAYRRIDIALDPFPFAGATTSCDALWMGVPIVTLAAGTSVGRSGASLLSHIGHSELIARSPEQYIQIAANLAADKPRLTDLRTTLRQRMQSSPVMDAPRFARDVESAYRTMWQTWCRIST